MQQYELVLDGERETVVETEDLVDAGDAFAIDDEIWLVLRESERAATPGRVRFECRRALRLRTEAQELIDYSNELQLRITKDRAAREP